MLTEIFDPALKKVPPDSDHSIEVQLRAGWNLIAYPLSAPLATKEVFGSIEDDSLLVKDEKGKVFIPSTGVSDLQMLQPGEAYMVLVGREHRLSFPSKEKHLDPNYQIELDEGWNLVGYHSSKPMPIDQAFGSIRDAVTIIRDQNGRAWIPFYHVNEIGQLKPMQGYKVYVSKPVTFSFGD